MEGALPDPNGCGVGFAAPNAKGAWEDEPKEVPNNDVVLLFSWPVDTVLLVAPNGEKLDVPEAANNEDVGFVPKDVVLPNNDVPPAVLLEPNGEPLGVVEPAFGNEKADGAAEVVGFAGTWVPGFERENDGIG